MAHGPKSDEKIVYVGDSRIRKGKGMQPPPDYSAFPGKSEAFIPNFLLKEWMAGVVVLVGFLVLTIAEPAPLGYPADPMNGSFIPMPDWYFLFIYQLLKYHYTSENYVVLGTIGIPGIAFGALLLAPFLDTGKERRFYRRPIASSLMFVSLVASVYLTWVSWHHYQEELEKSGIVPEHIEREEKNRESIEQGKGRFIPGREKLVALVNPDDPAFNVMKEAQCVACHGAELEGANGPSLRGIGDKLSKEELVDIITNGKNEGMPAFGKAKAGESGLSDEQIDQIATWLSEQKAAAAE
ncbi:MULTISPECIES: menaquinol-cytochrome c reductase cytochrome b/c subunit [Cohnella]|jgi:menaquinol-cytochrome c reductase cytochrome b/c subunit|uniref:menaquinol-cytochrome c reductase cytochrome b/c subunit n=1 Tax=Cohnella TaxID=329857 RepID=UPI000E3771C6|nr:menaquinol-cytochrome c reductase cytochrome b/c subunit [Cohnella sp.]REK66156.1 MAG: menaquinol-cytochrome C reductase [Cohnella sp.]